MTKQMTDMTKRAAAVIVASVVLASSMMGTANATSKPLGHQTQYRGQAVRVAAIKAYTLPSPRGDYTLDVPEGWSFLAGQLPNGQPADNTEDPIVLTPRGQSEPSAFIYGMVSISGLKASASTPSESQILSDPGTYVQAFLQAQAAAMTTRWTAADAVEMVIHWLGTLAPDAQLVALSPQSATQAIATVSYSPHGRLLESRWIISMTYMLNPAWTAVLGTNAWDSFAFIAGCEAPVGTLVSTEPVCAHILTSFQPAGDWLRAEIEAYLANQDQQMQMVQQTVDRVAQMQYQSQLEEMDTTYRVSRQWWKALGNVDDLRNPATGTTWWNVPDNFNYYCETPQGNLIGGNVEVTLRQSPDCQTMVQRVRP